jgi:multiple sugar transport system permease protein
MTASLSLLRARPGQPRRSFSSANSTGYPALAAAATFTTLPLMVFFLLLQRQFTRGALSAAGSIR